MHGDPKLLRQLFANLLTNAIKYSPDGGLITLSAIQESDNIMVSVQDKGIGIPQKDIDNIFLQYSRGSNVSDISGTGIGLYVVKMIVGIA